MVYAATTQIIYRYDSQYILSDSHGRIYHMRDYRIYAYIFLSSPTLQSESVAVTV